MNGEKRVDRLWEEKLNKQGCLMKIIKYNNAKNIIVEFQDEWGFQKKSTYAVFKRGEIKNPYYPSIYGVGVTGNKYPTTNNGEHIKEYQTWKSMLSRCYSNRIEVYNDVTCCNEWLLYENFYEWLHSQENFDKWLNNKKWSIDKDILVKGNKIYSPETCCLVPQNVNLLFTKANKIRSEIIGVTHRERIGMYEVNCCNPYSSKEVIYLGVYANKTEAFNKYKSYKENIIKKVAQKEYEVGNITKSCYEAMMGYKVEISD